MRREYDARFLDPHTAKADRFIWDYWHIKDQYTLLRTPAYNFFKPRTYSAFHNAILKYGREVLGCYDITPPWMSCYVEGCSQDLHADVPHGPWAFVFSLTNWQTRTFTGGETWMLKPETLQYWHNFSSLKGVERKDLVTEVPAEFNRLTVFDPRLPHGVKEVRGVRDPLQGRLVIHGWFKDPEPYVTGGLNRKTAADGLNEVLHRIFSHQQDFADCHGTLSYQIKVSPTGTVTAFKRTTCTLQSLTNSQKSVVALLKLIEKEIKKQKFGRAKKASVITFPILFRF
jgi:hypothetical protein